jgi:hypothetical protein
MSRSDVLARGSSTATSGKARRAGTLTIHLLETPQILADIGADVDELEPRTPRCGPFSELGVANVQCRK